MSIEVCGFNTAGLQNNLARKREQMKHMKMPELTELAENPAEGSEASKGTSVFNSSGASFTQPPPPTDSMVLPSIPDSFLLELGLFVDQYANFCCEDLSEQETENKFLSLSLAFKTDKLTLNQRLQIQKNSRDLAEENIQKELNSLKEVSELMVQQTNDLQVREGVNSIQHYVEILQQAVARISGRAEVFGAVQQEQRMSQAMEVMLAYVENLKRIQERDHLELEEAKKALTENKILTLDDDGDSSTLPRRTASLFNAPSKTAKRRASVAAVSKNPVPVGSTPAIQASMGILSRQEGQNRRSTLPAGRLLRRVSSFDRSSTMYDESSTDREGHVDRSVIESKTEESEESSFHKGYKKGLSTQMNSMIDNLATQQSCMVQRVQQMMENNDTEEDAPEKKLMVLSEVIADFQNDVISIWNGLSPFTQYVTIGFMIFLLLFAIVTRYSSSGKIDFTVSNQCETGPSI